MIELRSRLAHGYRVLAQEASDTLILLRLDDGYYYTLDEVGSRIWQLCDGVRTVSEIIATLSEEYAVSPDTVQRDTIELLEELTNEKLIVDGIPRA